MEPPELWDWQAGIAAQAARQDRPHAQPTKPVVTFVGAEEASNKRSRHRFAKQLDRVMRIAPLASVVLLVGNIGLATAPMLSWRGGHPAMWAAMAALFVGLAVVLAANLWAGRLDMIRAMRASGAYHDPTQVYQLTPWERIMWRHAMLPQMRHQADIGRADGADPSALEAEIERLEHWESLGYIPRDEYPEDLMVYYYGKGGRL